MKRGIILSFFLLITIDCCRAQSFQTALQQLQSLHYASYTEILKFKASFQDEISIDTFKNQVNFVPAEPKVGGYFSIKGHNDVYLFDGNKCIWLNLRDTTYEIRKDPVYGQECRTLLYWLKEMATWSKKPSQIKQLKDTVINKTAYNHTLVTLQDTVEKYEHVYNYVDIVTDKVSHLPIDIISRIHGFADDGALIGWTEEHIFIDYRFRKKNFPDLSDALVPANFKLPKKREIPPPLASGTKAPEITLHDATGNTFDSNSLKGKVVLLNFTTDGCPHCINAAQMLKRLNEKYKNTSFAIISIYQLGVNSNETVAKFDKKFNIDYPSYTTEKTAANIYNISGYPNFYLVDKQGNIAAYYDGFYAELEIELTDKIDQLK
jgi:thiol-disulfide isomerase/thioredoxin